MEESIKEVSLEEIFQTMYKNDFNEARTTKLSNRRVMKNAEEISSEDKQFLQIVKERATKADEHYVVLLPFGNKSLEIPNNRGQVLKRLMYLKARFKRNPSLFPDYKKLMDVLIKATSSNISSHHFVMEESMKKVSLE